MFGILTYICPRHPVLVKIGQKYQALDERYAHKYDNIQSLVVFINETDCVLCEVGKAEENVTDTNIKIGHYRHVAVSKILIIIACKCAGYAQRKLQCVLRKRWKDLIPTLAVSAFFLKIATNLKSRDRKRIKAQETLRSVEISQSVQR